MAIKRVWPGTALSVDLRGDKTLSNQLVHQARIVAGNLFDSMRPGQTFREGWWHGENGAAIKVSVWRTAQGEKALAQIYAVAGAIVEIEKLTLTYAVDTQDGDDVGPYVSIGEQHSHTSISIEISFGKDGPQCLACPPLAFKEWSDGSTANPRKDLEVKKDATYVASFFLEGEAPLPSVVAPALDAQYGIVRHSGCFGPFVSAEPTGNIYDYGEEAWWAVYNAWYALAVNDPFHYGQTYGDFQDWAVCNVGAYLVFDEDPERIIIHGAYAIQMLDCSYWTNLGSFSDEGAAYTAAKGYPIHFLQQDGKIHVSGCLMGVKYTINGSETKLTLWELLN